MALDMINSYNDQMTWSWFKFNRVTHGLSLKYQKPFRPLGHPTQYAVFPQDFPKFPQNRPQISEPISKFKVLPTHVYLSKRNIFFCILKGISSALINILDSYNYAVNTFWRVLFGKNVGKYCTDGYGRIRVYRVILATWCQILELNETTFFTLLRRYTPSISQTSTLSYFVFSMKIGWVSFYSYHVNLQAHTKEGKQPSALTHVQYSMATKTYCTNASIQ